MKQKMNFDLVIKNGVVVDGTGSSRRKADIGIIGDKIEAIGNLESANTKTVLDAAEKVVSPGFIDVHVHSELALLEGMDRYAPLKMGVTTQLASPDGFSWAPLKKDRLKEGKQYLHVFYNDHKINTDEDMSIEKFLSIFQGNIPSNLVLQVPHSSVRVAVMGWQNRAATDNEISKMENLVREWMEAGAVAFCTGLEYEPMRWSDLRELVRLSKVTSGYGGIYVAHQRGYAQNVRVGCQETFTISKKAEIPVHISHFTVDDLAEEQINQGVQEGVDVTFDMYPYPAGCTHLLMGLPHHLQVGPPESVINRLKDKSIRLEMEDYIRRAFPLDYVKFAAVGSQLPTGWEGKSLGEVQRELGMNLTDTVCEILLKTDLQALMIYHWEKERFQYLEKTFKHPLQMISTDGIYVGNKPHPRGFGTYPKVLGEYVREKKWLNLEEAIYKMSGFPAKRFNIKNRGVLAKGNYADLVIFDPFKIEGTSTFEAPRQDPIGIEHVLVNGKIVISNGKALEGNFGRIL